MVDEVSAKITIEGEDAVKSLNKIAAAFDQFQKSASSSTNRATSAFEVFKGSLAAGAVLSGLNALASTAKSVFDSFVTEGVHAATESELALKSLTLAFEQTGVGGKAAAAGFDEFANKVQTLTGYSSDAIVKNAALLQSIGKLTEEGLKKASVAAVELSAKTGRDLETSFRALEQASLGNVGALKKMGIEISKGTSDQQAFANALKAIQQFSGTAVGQMAVYAGAVRALGNSYGDAAKSLGLLIIQNPAVIGAINQLRTVFEIINQKIKENKDLISTLITGGINVLVLAFNGLLTVIQGTISFFQDNASAIKGLTAAAITAAVIFAALEIPVLAAAAATAVMTIATGALSFALILLNSPIFLIAAAVGVLVAAYNYLNINSDQVVGATKLLASYLLDFALFLAGPYFKALSLIVGIFNKEWGEAIDKAKGSLDDLQKSLAESAKKQLEDGNKIREAQQLQQDGMKKTKEVASSGLFEGLKVDQQALIAGTNTQIASEKALQAEYNNSAAVFAKSKGDQLAILQAFALAKQEKERSKRDQEVLDRNLANDEDYQYLVDNLGKREALKDISDARDLIRQGKQDQAVRKLRDARVKAEQNDIFAIQSYEQISFKQRVENTKQLLTTIATLQNSSNKTLFRVGQAAAIAQASINTFEAITLALRTYPFPASVAVAGLVGAIGFANVAKIASTQPAFADGGIVPGTSFSGDRVSASVNSGEMILNRGQQSELFHGIKNGDFGSGNSSAAIMELTNAIYSQPVVVKINNREIARATRGARIAGFAIA